MYTPTSHTGSARAPPAAHLCRTSFSPSSERMRYSLSSRDDVHSLSPAMEAITSMHSAKSANAVTALSRFFPGPLSAPAVKSRSRVKYLVQFPFW